MSMNTVPERLAALRAAMKANGVDVYLIPVGDPHSSEYLPDHYTSLGRRPLLCAGRKGDRRYRDPADADG